MDMQETLAGIIRDAMMDARNAGETIYKASDDASARILALLAPSTLRLQVEVEKLIAKWEEDRRGYPGEDWRGVIADTTVKLCMEELRHAVRLATPAAPVLERA